MNEASEARVMNRWLVVIGAILIQLALGAIYAWSVFTPPLANTNAHALALLYDAEILELDQDVHDRLMQTIDPRDEEGEMLDGPNKELSELSNKIKVAKSATERLDLTIEREGVVRQMDTETLRVYLDTAQLAELERALEPALASYEKANRAAREALDADEEAREAAGKQRAEANQGIAEAYAGAIAETPLQDLVYGFNNKQLMAIFSAGLFFFAVIMVLAGRMMPALGPRKLAIASGLVLGAGYALAGLVGGHDFWLHLICIGAIGGSGIGLGYVVPIAVAMRWFPDKKGMITGLAVAGFGFGALLWIKLGGDWGHLIAGFGLPTTFIAYGVAFAAMVIVGGLFMVFPPEGWLPAGYTPPAPKQTADGGVEQVDFTSGQMLVRPQYYMLLFMFIFGAGAGLMSIGLMKAYPIQALTDNGMELTAASAVAGTAMGIFFSLANGIGRIAWGTISDYIGRKASMFIMMGVQGAMMIAFPFMAGTTALLWVGATLIGFNFGGNFALFPTATTDTFGAKHIGQNYGWVFLGYGFGGIFGPILGGALGDMGNFPLAFTICGVLCLVAAVLALCVTKPRTRVAAIQASDAETAEQDGP